MSLLGLCCCLCPRYVEKDNALSEADGSLRKAFGVAKTLRLLLGRVTYVIDQESVVRSIFNALDFLAWICKLIRTTGVARKPEIGSRKKIGWTSSDD